MIPPAPNPPKSDQPERPDMTYLPRDCPFLKKEVWAIVTKQADGTWRIVNCLDKHEPCFKHNCAFTVDGGEWPFGDVTVDKQQLKDKP
jgi:hypothetical protein